MGKPKFKRVIKRRHEIRRNWLICYPGGKYKGQAGKLLPLFRQVVNKFIVAGFAKGAVANLHKSGVEGQLILNNPGLLQSAAAVPSKSF